MPIIFWLADFLGAQEKLRTTPIDAIYYPLAFLEPQAARLD